MQMALFCTPSTSRDRSRGALASLGRSRRRPSRQRPTEGVSDGASVAIWAPVEIVRTSAQSMPVIETPLGPFAPMEVLDLKLRNTRPRHRAPHNIYFLVINRRNT